MHIEITPVSKPRQTQSDRWKQRPAVMRYRAFADELRLKYRGDLPHSLKLVFYMPMPQSWSKKKQLAMVNTPHQAKPDFDNLAKAVCDALAKQDQYIWRCTVEKIWSFHAGIDIDPYEPER